MKTIIEMAREAGFKEHNGMIYVTTINDDCAKELEKFAALVRADKRWEQSKRTWVGLADAETEHLWEISRAAMPRYHTFKTLIEKALRERNT